MKSTIFLLAVLLAASFIQAQFSPIIWAQPVQGRSGPYSRCDVNEIEHDDSGNLYAAGYYEDTLTPDPNNLAYRIIDQGENGFFAKYDASGNFIWAKSIAWTIIKDMALDRYGNIFITGRFYDSPTVDFDPSANTANLTVMGAGFFIAKYDSNGTYLWAKALTTNTTFSYNENNCNVIQVDNSSNIYLGGSFRGTLDLDPGPGNYDIFNPGNVFQCPSCPIGFYAKYDSTGTFIWGKRDLSCTSVNDIAVNNTNGDIAIAANTGASFRYVLANGVSVDSTTSFGYGHGATSALFDQFGNLYFAGAYADNSSDFDWGPGSTILTSTGGSDMKYFVAKYDANRVFQWVSEYDIDGTVSSFVWDFEMNFSPDGNLLVGYCGVSSGVLFNGFSKISAGQNGPMLWTPTIFALGNGGRYGANIVSLPNSGHFYFHANFGYTGILTTLDADPNASTYNVNAVGSYGLLAKYGDCLGAPVISTGILGPNSVCEGSTNSYLITGTTGASSYNWTLPSGWNGTTSYSSVTATANGTGGNITVTAENGCGVSNAATLAVAVNPLPIASLDLSSIDTVCLNAGLVNLTGEKPIGGIYSGTGVSGNTFDPIVAGLGSHSIHYAFTDGNGCSDSTNASILVDICIGREEPAFGWISVSPNPTNGPFSVYLPEAESELTVMNAMGQQVLRTLSTGKTLNLTLCESGIYFLYARTSKGVVAKKIVVTR